ncbi:MAG: hypothetical protein FP820_07780 [Sulfurimonas sp.]|jgi:hypothetical protein|nr:hypothetical protein [Sulfurimonas sp.]MBU1216255.1 hypothetical protein [bacterium]MBU1434561.1 hypothetical protein [bacterium]MBU1502139.1 hypothetical protein [bacterium]MBU3938935.1 hypothetical protein [bacterium]
MELKDVILSTLAEMEDEHIIEKHTSGVIEKKESFAAKPVQKTVEQNYDENEEDEDEQLSNNSEVKYLSSIRERLLVLFEGFQAPNNTNIEAKVDMTLNFLEYVLATIDSRVEMLEKGNKK